MRWYNIVERVLELEFKKKTGLRVTKTLTQYLTSGKCLINISHHFCAGASSYDVISAVVIITASTLFFVTGACEVASAVPILQMGNLRLGSYRARLKASPPDPEACALDLLPYYILGLVCHLGPLTLPL